MTIQYSLIARKSIILCSYQEHAGQNFDMVASTILPKISTDANSKTSYSGDNNIMFNVLVDSGLIFLCACTTDMDRRVPFEFLETIKKQFFQIKTLVFRAEYASENEFNRDFGPVLAEQMEKYSRPDAGNDPLSTVRAQVDEVKGVMICNIEAVLERGQKLDDLLDKTTDLEASASTFQKTASKVKRTMWYRNFRTKCILVAIAVVVLFIIILIILFSVGVLPVKGNNISTTTTLAPK